MKFEFTLELAAPRDVVWRAFDNPANLAKWQSGLVSFRHVSGSPGQVGSVSELRFREGHRTGALVA